MRKVIFGINMSLDGCCDHTLFRPDKEIMEYFTRLLREADLLLYGRKTYQLMVPYWPDVAKNPAGHTKDENEFAKIVDSIHKVVFSRSLPTVEGVNTRIVRVKLAQEIRKLKQEPGKNISIGGVALPSQLIELGLVDEYHFVIHPVIVGPGRRLLEGNSLQKKTPLKLVESKVFKSGCVALHYLQQ